MNDAKTRLVLPEMTGEFTSLIEALQKENMVKTSSKSNSAKVDHSAAQIARLLKHLTTNQDKIAALVLSVDFGTNSVDGPNGEMEDGKPIKAHGYTIAIDLESKKDNGDLGIAITARTLGLAQYCATKVKPRTSPFG